MATIYLRSTDGNDADNGSTWALAKATLAAAITAAGAGGTVYMSQAHAESGSTITLDGGTAASPTVVLCVNDGAAPPTALATTGSIATTTSGAITINGFLYIYGVVFNLGSGATIHHSSGPLHRRFGQDLRDVQLLLSVQVVFPL